MKGEPTYAAQQRESGGQTTRAAVRRGEREGQKVKAAQDGWNSREPEKVALAYTDDSGWRNRDEFFEGRGAIVELLKRKWARELDYKLEKNLWCFTENRIAVRFEYESRDAEGQWRRSHPYDRIATSSRAPFAGGSGPRAFAAVTP